MLWPYSIRLNPVGAILFCFLTFFIYILFSSIFFNHQQDRTNLFFSNYIRNRFNYLSDQQKNLNADDKFIQLIDTKETILRSQLIDIKDLLVTSIKALKLSGHLIYDLRNSVNHFNVTNKGKTSEGFDQPLTVADLRSNDIIIDTLRERFPNLRVISEEKFRSKLNQKKVKMEEESEDRFVNSKFKSTDDQLDSIYVDDDIKKLQTNFLLERELLLYIDPLDATQEFTENLNDYVTNMLCVTRKGKPLMGIIYKPFSGRLYWAFVGKAVSTSLRNLIANRKLVLNNQSNGNTNNNNNLNVIISRSHQANVIKLINDAVNEINLFNNVNNNKDQNTYGQHVKIMSAGGSGYKAIEVLKGTADVYLHSSLIKKWDVCAPNAIFNAIDGAQMKQLNGDTIDYSDISDNYIRNGLIGSYLKERFPQVLHQRLADAMLKASSINSKQNRL